MLPTRNGKSSSKCLKTKENIEDGEEIVCTNEHPFYVPVKGWTAACQLRAGDRLQLVNGEYVIVEQIQHEILESPVKVYNFEVEDFHTYYVGEESVLVHNSCAHKKSSWRKQKSDHWKARAASKESSPLYDLTAENLELMSKGKAPFGFDGTRIELHHVKGINNSPEIVEMTKASHTILHKYVGYKNMLEYVIKM